VKTLRKILKYSIIILVLILVFRGWIYRNTFHYTIIKERSQIELTDKTLKTEIDKEIAGKNLSLPQTIKTARKITNKNLFFSTEKISFNPNISIKTGKANCIGYSAMLSSVFNYIVKKQNNNTKYRVKHLVGKIDFLGLDIHKLFESSFFKDHDFNEIINLETDEKEYIDPNLSDYFYIHRVSVNEKYTVYD